MYAWEKFEGLTSTGARRAAADLLALAGQLGSVGTSGVWLFQEASTSLADTVEQEGSYQGNSVPPVEARALHELRFALQVDLRERGRQAASEFAVLALPLGGLRMSAEELEQFLSELLPSPDLSARLPLIWSIDWDAIPEGAWGKDIAGWDEDDRELATLAVNLYRHLAKRIEAQRSDASQIKPFVKVPAVAGAIATALGRGLYQSLWYADDELTKRVKEVVVKAILIEMQGILPVP